MLGEVSIQVNYDTKLGTYMLYAVKDTSVNLLGRDLPRNIRLNGKYIYILYIYITQTVNSVSESYQPLLDRYSLGNLCW